MLPLQATPESTRTPDAVTLAAASWFAAGLVLLGLTPLPLHTEAWGWSPLFWLLAAPAAILCARRFCAQTVAGGMPVRRCMREPAASTGRRRHAAATRGRGAVRTRATLRRQRRAG